MEISGGLLSGHWPLGGAWALARRAVTRLPLGAPRRAQVRLGLAACLPACPSSPASLLFSV